jgi:hypothetical protein
MKLDKDRVYNRGERTDNETEKENKLKQTSEIGVFCECF